MTTAFRTIELPKHAWYTCFACNGKGSYLSSADCHRSEGWVPCNAPGCSNGTIKYEREYFEWKPEEKKVVDNSNEMVYKWGIGH